MAVRDESSSPTLLAGTLSTLARQHIALLLPFVGAVIFAIRCTVVGRGDPNTAAMLIVETSLQNAIQAVLISVLPILLMLLVIMIAWMAGEYMLTRGLLDPISIALMLATVISIPVALYLGGGFTASGSADLPPAIAVVIFLFLCVQTATYANIRLQGAIRASRLRGFYVVIVALVILMVSLPLFHPGFWLPPERLTFRNESAFTGYVLKASEDYLTIFRERERILIQWPKANLVKREFCHFRYGQTPSSGGSKYLPECPRS